MPVTSRSCLPAPFLLLSAALPGMSEEELRSELASRAKKLQRRAAGLPTLGAAEQVRPAGVACLPAWLVGSADAAPFCCWQALLLAGSAAALRAELLFHGCPPHLTTLPAACSLCSHAFLCPQDFQSPSEQRLFQDLQTTHVSVPVWLLAGAVAAVGWLGASPPPSLEPPNAAWHGN
jgi:hypothetical protein